VLILSPALLYARIVNTVGLKEYTGVGPSPGPLAEDSWAEGWAWRTAASSPFESSADWRRGTTLGRVCGEGREGEGGRPGVVALARPRDIDSTVPGIVVLVVDVAVEDPHFDGGPRTLQEASSHLQRQLEEAEGIGKVPRKVPS